VLVEISLEAANIEFSQPSEEFGRYEISRAGDRATMGC
jgi:hypothetical protein